MVRFEVRELTADALDEAARLLSDRHQRQRHALMALDRRYEDPVAAREQIAALLDRDGASGSIVLLHGRGTAFVLGAPRADPTWGPNVWIEAAGSAGSDVEAIREAYAAASGRWVDEGHTNHFVIVPATEVRPTEAWFSLGFGKQHVHALREPPWREFEPTIPEGMTIRPAQREDIPALAELDRVLPRYQAGAPIFSYPSDLTVEQARADIEAEFDDPSYATFVAEVDGTVVGAAVATSLEVSPGHSPIMRPRSAGLLGFAAVLPDARGRGAGRALGETVMKWSVEEGYEWVAVDWRSANIQANRAWLALGFKPSFYRLHRAIARV